MKRDPAACLADRLDYARDTQAFVAGMTAKTVLADRKPQYAVLHALEVIGEAANRAFRPRCGPDTRKSRGARSSASNVIAHDYLGIRLSLLRVHG